MRQMIQRAVFSELGKFGTEDVYGDIVVLATANLRQSVASVVMGLDALSFPCRQLTDTKNAGRPTQYFNDQCVFDGRNHPDHSRPALLILVFSTSPNVVLRTC